MNTLTHYRPRIALTAGPTHPLWVTLPGVWCGGFLSAFGIGAVRAEMQAYAYSGGGGTAAFGALFVLAVAGGCQVFALLAVTACAKDLAEPPSRPVGAAFVTLLLGGVGMLGLNSVLTAGASFPGFGALSVLLLCLPYPIVFTLLHSIGRRAALTAVGATVLLVLCVVPVRAGQEWLAGTLWRGQHPGVDRRLLQTVDWPGGHQESFDLGRHMLRTDVFFADSTIDGFADGLVTVAPAATQPCGPLAVISDGDMDGSADDTGSIVTIPVTQCRQTGPGSWELSTDAGWRGLAERRDGVLLILSADSARADDDLAAVARTLRPLGDQGLWAHGSEHLGWAWLLL
ncbi:hypothetical protein [Streptacidiphilus rugosus]|uniref:hypothetical protein n=1 Tax=Streptacidiphilus rugosus TaxID=405783 RepID=UPI000559FAAA|nr:hypothetical protein [Streptacidiphilus rugosus]